MPAGWNLPTEVLLENCLSLEQLRSKRLLRPLLPYERQDRSFAVREAEESSEREGVLSAEEVDRTGRYPVRAQLRTPGGSRCQQGVEPPGGFSWRTASLSEQLRSKRLLRPLLPYERQDRSFAVERPRKARRRAFSLERKLIELDGIRFELS